MEVAKQSTFNIDMYNNVHHLLITLRETDINGSGFSLSKYYVNNNYNCCSDDYCSVDYFFDI